jgi:hypothetical protein
MAVWFPSEKHLAKSEDLTPNSPPEAGNEAVVDEEFVDESLEIGPAQCCVRQLAENLGLIDGGCVMKRFRQVSDDVARQAVHDSHKYGSIQKNSHRPRWVGNPTPTSLPRRRPVMDGKEARTT